MNEASSPDEALITRYKPNWVLYLLRATLAATLVGVLLSYFDLSSIYARFVAINPLALVVALLVLGAQYLGSWMRWHFILTRREPEFSLRRSFAIYGLGNLANIFLVTSLAGLSARALLLVRERVAVTDIVSVLLVERLAAGIGMAICIGAGLAFSTPVLLAWLDTTQFKLKYFQVLATIAVIAVAASIVLWQSQLASDVIKQIRYSFLSVTAVGALAIASAVIVVLGFCAVAVLAAGMKLQIDPIFFFSIMPVVAFISALPISIGGWGVREGSMVLGLSLFNVHEEAALALSLTYGIAGLVMAVFFVAIALFIYLLVWRPRIQDDSPERDS